MYNILCLVYFAKDAEYIFGYNKFNAFCHANDSSISFNITLKKLRTNNNNNTISYQEHSIFYTR